jgi:hypothetical protein
LYFLESNGPVVGSASSDGRPVLVPAYASPKRIILSPDFPGEYQNDVRPAQHHAFAGNNQRFRPDAMPLNCRNLSGWVFQGLVHWRAFEINITPTLPGLQFLCEIL